jgi:nucleotide-binding universal stress UspA family protein
MSYRIVVGVEGSPQSVEALRWALDEAAVHPGSEVRVVLAWQLPFLSNPAAFNREELQLTYEEFLVKTVSEIVPVPDFPLETLVAMGDTVETLVVAAKGAQLLVLGGRGRSSFAGLMLGSVSQACAARAECPVVVVKKAASESQ